MPGDEVLMETVELDKVSNEWTFKCNLTWSQMTRYLQAADHLLGDMHHMIESLKPEDDYDGVRDNPFAFVECSQ